MGKEYGAYWYRVKGYREGKKVRQRVLEYLGMDRPVIVENVEREKGGAGSAAASRAVGRTAGASILTSSHSAGKCGGWIMGAGIGERNIGNMK